MEIDKKELNEIITYIYLGIDKIMENLEADSITKAAFNLGLMRQALQNFGHTHLYKELEVEDDYDEDDDE